MSPHQFYESFLAAPPTRYVACGGSGLALEKENNAIAILVSIVITVLRSFPPSDNDALNV
jgi:hypothetical protein